MAKYTNLKKPRGSSATSFPILSNKRNQQNNNSNNEEPKSLDNRIGFSRKTKIPILCFLFVIIIATLPIEASTDLSKISEGRNLNSNLNLNSIDFGDISQAPLKALISSMLPEERLHQLRKRQTSLEEEAASRKARNGRSDETDLDAEPDRPETVITSENAAADYEAESTSHPQQQHGRGRQSYNGNNNQNNSNSWIHPNNANKPLRIVRLLAPEAAQNGTQNVTLDCMFKFDKKLDQRLTIKWFFNDEVEPIYQWIPELNKRVYSDKYERFLDKSYQVSEDVEFMLRAYKWFIANGGGDNQQSQPTLATNSRLQATGLYSSAPVANSPEGDGLLAGSSDSLESLQRDDDQTRRLLANRLNKLAKLGGKHSKQLLESLRATLHMDQLDFSRFRALRLIRPTTELNGRFTCSVASLDGDDIRSTRLVIYEPAKNFAFNVSRLASGQYNLSCQADQLFPRPSLLLSRYRAGPLELYQQHPRLQEASSHWPRVPATTLRQEPLQGTQSQITLHLDNSRNINANGHNKPQSQATNSLISDNGLELEVPNDVLILDNNNKPTNGVSGPDEIYTNQNNFYHSTQQPIVYGISSWALVDEQSLSSNVVTQFECLLLIDGASNYEQRQSLALQRGWHVNSAALTSRSTLLGLFSALASLLCLMLALISSFLIFKLLKRHAKNRVHERHLASETGNAHKAPDNQQKAKDTRANASFSDNFSNATNSTGQSGSDHQSSPPIGNDASSPGIIPNPSLDLRPKQITSTLTDVLAANSESSPALRYHQQQKQQYQQNQFAPQRRQQFAEPSNRIHKQNAHFATNNNLESDGVYRIPENSSFGGTRFIIGPRTSLASTTGGIYHHGNHHLPQTTRNRTDRLSSLQI